MSSFSEGLEYKRVITMAYRVPCVESTIVCSLEQWQCLVLLDHPWLPRWVAKAHASKDWDRYSQSRLAQLLVAGLGLIDRLDHWIAVVLHVEVRHICGLW